MAQGVSLMRWLLTSSAMGFPDVFAPIFMTLHEALLDL